MAKKVLKGNEELNKMIPSRARGRRNFTKPERKRMVDVLSINDWNYSKTQKELAKQGISISIASLKKYRGEYADLIPNLPDQYIANWEDKFNEESDGLIKNTLTLRNLIVERMIELVPSATLRDLTPAMEMLNKMTEGKDGGDGYDKTLSLIDQMNDHLNKQYEQKNKSEGDIHDVSFEPVN